MTPAFQFRLPESFMPGEFLRSIKLQNRFDDARYFVNLILMKTARGDVDEGEYVRLKAEYLRRIMHFRSYNAIVDALLEGDAITRMSYLVGTRAFGYRLADRFLQDKHVRRNVTDPRLNARIEAYHAKCERDRRERMKPVHFALQRQQFRLGIDSELAREIIATLPLKSNPFDVQGILVTDIENRDFRFNVGRYGRVSNSISSMKREVRAALRLNAEPLSSIDIACCQPALIGKQAQDNRRRHQQGTEQAATGEGGQAQPASVYDVQQNHPIGRDLDFYCELVQSGKFYEFMLEQLRTRTCPNLERDELKKRFLADVIAKKKANQFGAEYPSDVEGVFRDLFPSVYAFIRHINCDGWKHANLIRLLQQEESKLVIESVAADLTTNHPELFVLTLHDAVFTTERSVPIVIEAFEAAFRRYDYRMALK